MTTSAILLLLTSLFLVEKSSTLKENKIFSNELQTVVFLNKESASTYLSNSSFYEKTNDYLDASIRLEQDLSTNTKEVNKTKLKNYALDQTLNWEAKEIKRVYSIFLEVQELINSKSKNVLQDTLYLIKTTGKEEFDAHYTVNKAIVIPKTELKFLWIKPRRLNVMGTYIHEYFHIFTRYNLSEREEMYATIGFHPIDDFVIEDDLNNQRITNPDFLDLGYSITLTDSLQNRNEYTLLIISKHNKFDGKKGVIGQFNTLLGYVDLGLFKVDENGRITNERISLNNEEFYEKIGRISTYRYGADEIIAEAFKVMITEDYHNNNNYSSRDKEILDKIKAILE